MNGVLIEWNVEFTILTIFGSLGADVLMLVEFAHPELLLAKLAVGLLMELLLVLLLAVNIVHFPTLATPLDIPPAIPKVRGHFRLGELLLAVVAPFQAFTHQRKKFPNYLYYRIPTIIPI